VRQLTEGSQSVTSAKEARIWVADGGLHGIGDSLYTPFAGRDGDEIDWDAYRLLVRYCVGDLRHEMLWLTSGIGEWWSLTLAERKKLVEVAIREARRVAPDTVIQVCTTALSAKDCVELTLHAQESGADIAYIQTPVGEVHAGAGVLRFFQYVADRTDIALGMFNSPSSGYVLTPEECARIYHEIPAVCAIKEGVMEQYTRSKRLHALAPGLAIWECDLIVYRAGWLEDGIVTPAQLGTAAYLDETPDNLRLSTYWKLIWDGQIDEAIRHYDESGLEILTTDRGNWFTCYPGRPDYFSHWGEAFKFAASVLGLPVGDYPHSRPPQAYLPEEAKGQIRRAYENSGITLASAGK
jgi:4-hydroxy-tetrahydrodipicolinate synthase